MMLAMLTRDSGMHRLGLVWTAALVLVGSACGDDGSPGGADSTGADSTAGASTGVSATGMVDVGESLDSSGGSTSGSSSGILDGSFLDGMTTEDPPPPMEQPNGAQCMGGAECVSGFCYQIPMLGGICSECLVDSDCPSGTCSLDPVGYAVCTDGSLGVMCNSDDGCMGDLVCAELIDTGGLFNANFCSECNDATPCAGGQICSPVYDLASFQGYLGCVDPGTVPDGGGCPLDAGGMGEGAACQSGLCGVASLLGVLPIGVCGECLTDMDCMGMETCTPPVADMSGLQGAVCM